MFSKYRIRKSGNDIYVQTSYGTFVVPEEVVSALLRFHTEDLEEIYGRLNVKSKVVADVRAYLGETSVFFAKRGAKKVIAYEPMFWLYTEKNIEMNSLTDVVEVRRYGVWFRDEMISVELDVVGTGMRYGPVEAEFRQADFWGVADVVKMDCGGCEWLLVTQECKTLRSVEQYVVKIHGPDAFILNRMLKCGFSARFVDSVVPFVSVWHFKPR
jgi:methyltransferase, FkbM family